MIATKVREVFLVLIFLSGCSQLPKVEAPPINAMPSFDASAIISSKNGLLASDLARVPGRLCVPDKSSGLCSADGILAGQYIAPGARVVVSPPTSTQPMYHSLLDNRYSAGANVPFLGASASEQVYDEVRATTVATALITGETTNAGFPVVESIKTALKNAGADPNVNFVYWLEAANVISVTRSSYQKVTSTAQVTGTAFGANGATYNYNGGELESSWIGVVARKIILKGAAPLAPNQTLPAAERTQFFNVDSQGVIRTNGERKPVLSRDSLASIAAIATSSTCAKTNWNGRGRAPTGYIKGMALTYAKSVCETVIHADTGAVAMRQPFGDSRRDALAWYELSDNGEMDRLRSVYVLGIGLGMRESSGNSTEGWDTTVKNPTADSAEAGLFQTSYDSFGTSPWLEKLYRQYNVNPESCYQRIFVEGAPILPRTIIGDGPGADYQRFTKACPAFAAEYAMIMLRENRQHFGPINRHEAEYRDACESMLRDVGAVAVRACSVP